MNQTTTNDIDTRDWPTTRRFPRTMQEAWPSERRHAYAVERVYSGRYDRIASYLLAISIGTALALLLFYHL